MEGVSEVREEQEDSARSYSSLHWSPLVNSKPVVTMSVGEDSEEEVEVMAWKTRFLALIDRIS